MTQCQCCHLSLWVLQLINKDEVHFSVLGSSSRFNRRAWKAQKLWEWFQIYSSLWALRKGICHNVTALIPGRAAHRSKAKVKLYFFLKVLLTELWGWQKRGGILIKRTHCKFKSGPIFYFYCLCKHWQYAKKIWELLKYWSLKPSRELKTLMTFTPRERNQLRRDK